MATREEVLAAYAANPKAELNPSQEAINFWMQGGLQNFNNIVDEARAQNPTLAASIDAQRAAINAPVTQVTTPAAINAPVNQVTTPAVDYDAIVRAAYGGIGRTGFGTAVNQIDPGGYDFWLNALQSGTLTPQNFQSSFNRAVSQYVAENPATKDSATTNPLTEYVTPFVTKAAQINPFANVGMIKRGPEFQTGNTIVPGGGATDLQTKLQRYTSIPIGSQFDPYATAGTASPYDWIRAQTPGFANPYADAVSNQAMGGFDPNLYTSLLKDSEEAATRRRLASAGLIDYVSGGDGATSAGGDSTGNAAASAAAAGSSAGADGGAGGVGIGEGGGTGMGGWAKGGLVDRVAGPDPAGPDDGTGMLDIGEYVIKKSSVNKYGKGLLDMINDGKIPAKKMKSLLG